MIGDRLPIDSDRRRGVRRGAPARRGGRSGRPAAGRRARSSPGATRRAMPRSGAGCSRPPTCSAIVAALAIALLVLPDHSSEFVLGARARCRSGSSSSRPTASTTATSSGSAIGRSTTCRGSSTRVLIGSLLLLGVLPAARRGRASTSPTSRSSRVVALARDQRRCGPLARRLAVARSGPSACCWSATRREIATPGAEDADATPSTASSRSASISLADRRCRRTRACRCSTAPGRPRPRRRRARATASSAIVVAHEDFDDERCSTSSARCAGARREGQPAAPAVRRAGPVGRGRRRRGRRPCSASTRRCCLAPRAS